MQRGNKSWEEPTVHTVLRTWGCEDECLLHFALKDWGKRFCFSQTMELLGYQSKHRIHQYRKYQQQPGSNKNLSGFSEKQESQSPHPVEKAERMKGPNAE